MACRIVTFQIRSRLPTQINEVFRQTISKSLSTNKQLGKDVESSSSSSWELTKPQSTNELATRNVDFDSSAAISGNESQILTVKIEPGEMIRAESGAMLYMTQGVEMNTTLGTSEGNDVGGAIKSGLKRMMTGQNLFLSDYTYSGQSHGTLALGTDFPSKILQLNLENYAGKIVCQKGAFMAGGNDVDIQMEFTKKMTAGFFGGEGFILQGLVGNGTVFCKAGGTIIKRELQEGEILRISSGCLVAFTKDIEYDVQTVSGFKNVLFGGEGLFVTSLTGPGIVWLQSMPPDRMISEISRRIPSGGIGLGIPIGMGGGSTGEGTEEGEDSVMDQEQDNSEQDGSDSIGTTESAVEMDRNATVVSSGTPANDFESPSALFGDVAEVDTDTLGSIDPVNSDSSSLPSSDESTEFPHQESFGDDLPQSSEFDDFSNQDDTSFSTEIKDDSFDSPPSEDFDTFNGDDNTGNDESGGIGSILGSLWDMFKNDDD